MDVHYLHNLTVQNMYTKPLVIKLITTRGRWLLIQIRTEHFKDINLSPSVPILFHKERLSSNFYLGKIEK
jgi:hypothetical protein